MIAHRRALSAAASLATLTLTVTSCTSGGGKPDGTTHSDSTSPALSTSVSSTVSSAAPASTSSADREAADRAAVEKAWRNYWAVYLSLEAKYPNTRWKSVVGKIAVDPIHSQILIQAAKYRSQGIETFGHVVTRPSWPRPISGKSTAVMADCQDGTHAGSRVVRTAKQRTVGEPRTNIRATFVRGHDGVWRVKQIKYLGTPC